MLPSWKSVWTLWYVTCNTILFTLNWYSWPSHQCLLSGVDNLTNKCLVSVAISFDYTFYLISRKAYQVSYFVQLCSYPIAVCLLITIDELIMLLRLKKCHIRWLHWPWQNVYACIVYYFSQILVSDRISSYDIHAYHTGAYFQMTNDQNHMTSSNIMYNMILATTAHQADGYSSNLSYL